MSDLPGSQGSGGAVSLEALARTSNCAKPQPKLRHHPLADLFPMMQGQSSTDFCIALQSDDRLLDEIVLLDLHHREEIGKRMMGEGRSAVAWHNLTCGPMP